MSRFHRTLHALNRELQELRGRPVRVAKAVVGAGGGPSIIRFTIVSVDTDAGTAEVTVDAVSCGGSLPYPNTVTVHDALGCLLDESEADLIGRQGYAVKMTGGAYGGCDYEIISLCCA